MFARDHFQSRNRSSYLRERRVRDRRAQRVIAKRIAIGIALTFSGFVFGALCYFLLAYTDAIAASTRDHRNLIGTLGLASGFISFTAFILLPFVALGIMDE